MMQVKQSKQKVMKGRNFQERKYQKSGIFI